MSPHHMCTHTCSHARAHTSTHVHARAEHTQAHTCTCSHVRAHVSTCSHASTHAHTCTCSCTEHMHTRVHAHMYEHTRARTHAHIAPRPGGDGLNSYLGLAWPGCTDRPPSPAALCRTVSWPLQSQPEGPCRAFPASRGECGPPSGPHGPGPAPSSPAAGVCLGPLLPCSLGRQGAPEGWDPACFAPVSSAASRNAGWGWGVGGSAGEGDGGCERAE